MHYNLYHKLYILFIFVDILSDLEISKAIKWTTNQKIPYFCLIVISRIILGNNIDWKRITGSNYPVIQGASITLTTAFWTQLQFPGGSSMWKALQQSTHKAPQSGKGTKAEKLNVCKTCPATWSQNGLQVDPHIAHQSRVGQCNHILE